MTPRALSDRLGMPGKIAAVAACAAVVSGAWGLWGLGGAVLAPAAQAQANKADDRTRAESFKKEFDAYLAQFDGRSVFFVPAAPVAAAPEPEPAKDDGPPPPPPKPTSYAGPGLIAMIYDTAWFDNGTKLRAGGEGEGDLKVLRVLPPWEAVVEWKGVEFTVGLFPHDTSVIPREKPVPPKDASTTDAAKTDTPPAPAPAVDPVHEPSNEPGAHPGNEPAKEPVQPDAPNTPKQDGKGKTP